MTKHYEESERIVVRGENEPLLTVHLRDDDETPEEKQFRERRRGLRPND